MKIKFTFLAALFALVFGIQSAQAQKPGELKIDRSKIVVDSSTLDVNALKIREFQGVSGTITLPNPLGGQFKDFQCTDLEIAIGEVVTPSASSGGGIAIPVFNTTALTKGRGQASSGKCSYHFANPKTNVTAKTMEVRVLAPTKKYGCQGNYVNFNHQKKTAVYPTGAKNTVVDFGITFDCISIN